MRTRTDNSFMPGIERVQIAIESKTCPSDSKHHFYSVEIDANRRAAKYFFNEVDWPFVQKGYPISLNRIVIL